ncbi:MAG TPA: carboxypeptidase-like regulatory domain-containing protein [Gemmatimonadaceae bacterium]|nr:carboxypeptidase-like regulatory domain-containing protein [Gemmatimonadaceae bacterium]
MARACIIIDRGERHVFAAICLVSILPLSAASSQAQSELRVRLESSDGTPVAGALVALLGANDSVVAEGLSTEKGARLLRAPSGVYRVRARRIGFLPFVSAPVVIPRQDEVLLAIETARVVLDRIVVNSKSQCNRNDPGSRSLGIVWDEIDKALRASQLTIADLSGFGRGRVYHKEVGPGGNIISTDTTLFAIVNQRPFGAIDPDSLARAGYVFGDEAKGWIFYAPDETVLLSDQFAATHCFRLVREAARSGAIGVAFEPVPQRKVADIVGVLWVDERSAELREVVFHFVNAGVLNRFEAGGFTRFLRVASGAWIVDEWLLKLPRLAVKRSAFIGEQYMLVGYYEHGGGILNGERHAPGVADSLNRKH